MKRQDSDTGVHSLFKVRRAAINGDLIWRDFSAGFHPLRRGAFCCTGTDYPTARTGSFVIESDDRPEALERRWPIESSHVATDVTCRDLDHWSAIADIRYDRPNDDGHGQWIAGRRLRNGGYRRYGTQDDRTSTRYPDERCGDHRGYDRENGRNDIGGPGKRNTRAHYRFCGARPKPSHPTRPLR